MKAPSPCSETYGLEYWWRVKIGIRTLFLEGVAYLSSQWSEPELRILDACWYKGVEKKEYFFCLPGSLAHQFFHFKHLSFSCGHRFNSCDWDTVIALNDTMAFREHRTLFTFPIFMPLYIKNIFSMHCRFSDLFCRVLSYRTTRKFLTSEIPIDQSLKVVQL